MANKAYHATTAEGMFQCSQISRQDIIITFTRYDLSEHIVIRVPMESTESYLGAQADILYSVNQMQNQMHLRAKMGYRNKQDGVHIQTAGKNKKIRFSEGLHEHDTFHGHNFTISMPYRRDIYDKTEISLGKNISITIDETHISIGCWHQHNCELTVWAQPHHQDNTTLHVYAMTGFTSLSQTEITI